MRIRLDRPDRRRVGPAAGALVGTALLLTGCSSTDGPAPGPVASPGAPATTAASGAGQVATLTEPDPASPLAAYELTETEMATVSYAWGILIDRCLQRFGFEYPHAPFSANLQHTLADARVAASRLWGISDPAAAAEHGYAYPETPRDAEQPEPPESAAYQFVYGGRKVDTDGGLPAPRLTPETTSPGTIDGVEIPPGGCAGDASRELGYADDPDVSDYGLARGLALETWSAFRSSETYRTVVGEWVACMAERGHHVTDVLDDKADIMKALEERTARGTELDADGGRIPAEKPSSGEVALATADVACKEKTDLVGRLDAALADAEEATVEEHHLALEEDRVRRDAQVKLATALVEGADR